MTRLEAPRPIRPRTLAFAFTLTLVMWNCASQSQIGVDPNGGDAGGDDAPSLVGDGGIDCVHGPDFTGCPCNVGDTKACWTGPAAERGSGMCKDGTQACRMTGELQYAFGPCTGEVLDCGTGLGADGGEDAPSDCTLPAPRLVFPLSTSRVTSQTPLLKWELSPGTDGARIEVCDSRDCTNVVQRWDVSGSQTTVPSTLPRGAHWWRATGMKAGHAGCTPSVVWEFFSNIRSANGPNTAWGTVLDVNEDGYADLFMDQTDGSNSIYLGGPSGLASTMSSSIPLAGGAGYFGCVDAGDLNGDGFADVANLEEVGSPSPPLYLYAGRVNVYFGGVAGVSTKPDVQIVLPTTTWPGWVIRPAGDVNGDGYGDFLVSDPLQSTVYLHLGSARGPATTPATTLHGSTSFYGWGLAAAGDVNGDTFGDVIVGADVEDTRQYIFHGGPGGLSTTPTTIISPPPPLTGGGAVNAAGDVNGDGYADVMVNGEGENDGPDGIYVYLGSATGVVSTPSVMLSNGMTTENEFGGRSEALDVNGDGYWDVAVIDDKDYSTYPAMDIFMGGPGGISPTFAVTFPPLSQYRWLAMTGGDVDGDGYEDLMTTDLSSTASTLCVFRGSLTGIQTTAVTPLGSAPSFSGQWLSAYTSGS